MTVQSMTRTINANEDLDEQIDSIAIWIGYSKNNDYELKRRILYLNKAYKSTLQIKNDSL